MKAYAVFGLSTMYEGDKDIIVLPLEKKEFAYFEISNLRLGNNLKTTLTKKFPEKRCPHTKIIEIPDDIGNKLISHAEHTKKIQQVITDVRQMIANIKIGRKLK